MTDTTKTVEKPKRRLTLSPRSIAFAIPPGGTESDISAVTMEDAVIRSEARIKDLEAQLRRAKEVPSGVSKTLLQRETDQLHLELTTLATQNHRELMGVMRMFGFMLNTYGEDLCGSDVEDLISETRVAIAELVGDRDNATQQGHDSEGRIQEMDARSQEDEMRDLTPVAVTELQKAATGEQLDIQFDERIKDDGEREM